MLVLKLEAELNYKLVLGIKTVSIKVPKASNPVLYVDSSEGSNKSHSMVVTMTIESLIWIF